MASSRPERLESSSPISSSFALSLLPLASAASSAYKHTPGQGLPWSATCPGRGQQHGNTDACYYNSWPCSTSLETLCYVPHILFTACSGPGAFDFKQGDTEGTIFWRVVSHFLKDPSTEQIACQAPKPILLDTGSVHVPYEWYVSESCSVPCLHVGHGLCALCSRVLHLMRNCISWPAERLPVVERLSLASLQRQMDCSDDELLGHQICMRKAMLPGGQLIWYGHCNKF